MDVWWGVDFIIEPVLWIVELLTGEIDVVRWGVEVKIFFVDEWIAVVIILFVVIECVIAE
jgi:hypothetical protein